MLPRAKAHGNCFSLGERRYNLRSTGRRLEPDGASGGLQAMRGRLEPDGNVLKVALQTRCRYIRVTNADDVGLF